MKSFDWIGFACYFPWFVFQENAALTV